ncbi:MAG TPA: response regulator transcription factor [Micropruina sp.]|nr:response regulator transcription factor [Micropruina sp.]HMR23150.1 response regulator transcription factor [Micropruina sp.]
MIRVLLADDQELIRTALATTLGLEDDLEVVGVAGSCAAAVEAAARTRPDVVLLDVQMPTGGLAGEDGIDAIVPLLAVAPDARVLVVTTFGRPGYLRRALEAGAIGFMVKDAPIERLLEGIRRANRGLRQVDPELAAASLSLGASPLTEREGQVLAASVGGATTAEIAAAVFLSEGTVRNYLSAAIGKLGARNRAEAIRTAVDNGWI